MYETTIERLAGAGLAMYEISNFAKPGQESRHNLAYWANDAYFGFGVGAARYVRGRAIGQYTGPSRLPAADRVGRAGGPARSRNCHPRAGHARRRS